jgi:hypothetical protein
MVCWRITPYIARFGTAVLPKPPRTGLLVAILILITSPIFRNGDVGELRLRYSNSAVAL